MNSLGEVFKGVCLEFKAKLFHFQARDQVLRTGGKQEQHFEFITPGEFLKSTETSPTQAIHKLQPHNNREMHEQHALIMEANYFRVSERIA